VSRRRRINDLWWVGLGVLAIAAALLGTQLKPTAAAPETAPNTVVVYKSPTCNCCSKWVEHLKQSGMTVEVHNESEMTAIKNRLGVPPELASCHTATVNGYVIEGHVPAEDIQRLLIQRPKARGLAVPGMPVGSPGMEMGSKVDPYDVLLIQDDQSHTVYAKHGPQAAP